MTVRSIAEDVRTGRVSAVTLARAAIDRCKADPYRAVTRVLEERALAEAAAVDAKVAAGRDPGPLAGVPYGVKDLFDVAGLVTTAGSIVRHDARPARRDADAVRRFAEAGAVLVATLNMDEFAYGFATINAHYGTTANPHAPDRIAGGSSGGSAAAMAGGLLPLALGSDTNGSIRVPAALCGLYGLKCTHGDLPLGGVFPFAESFDDIGPFAADLADLTLACEVLRGRAYESVPVPARVGFVGGWFASNRDAETKRMIELVGGSIGGGIAEIAQVDIARSAAFLMTAYEGGHLHLPTLRERATDYDPQVRDRLIAGAMLGDEAYATARAFRERFTVQAESLFRSWDVLVTPATPCAAPTAADPTIPIDGAAMPARAQLGLFTQPIAFLGLPALTVPLKECGPLPIGLQLVGPKGGEAQLFALAADLEARGFAGAWEPKSG